MTYTYAILDVSQQTYDEIAAKIKAAGYDHAFHTDDGKTVIDMHGIALRATGHAGSSAVGRNSTMAGRECR